MFETAYDTTSGKLKDTKELHVKLQRVLIDPNIRQQSLNLRTDLSVRPVFLTGLYQEEAEVPLFPHSILVETRHGLFLVTDVRLAINAKKLQETESVKESIVNANLFEFMLNQAALNLVWVAEGPLALNTVLRPSDLLYATVMSETISRSYMLNMQEKMSIAIASLIFYTNLFYDNLDKAIDVAEHAAFKYYPIQGDFYTKVAEQIKQLDTIQDLIEVMKTLAPKSLSKLSTVSLYTLFSKLWYGGASKDLITVALEHPPTWINILYAATTVRLYRNTGVFRISERVKFGLKYGNLASSVEEVLDDTFRSKSLEGSYIEVMEALENALNEDL